MDNAKRELLNKTLNDINKRFGKGTVMSMENKTIQPIDVIPTGSFLLDRALGVGGWPKGRIIEVYAGESVGKTSLALHAIAETQKQGGVGAIIDVEHALDPAYAAALGVNLDDLIISQPDCGEDALEIVEDLVRSAVVDFIVVDSVAALTPRAEIDGEMGDAHVGLLARLMSQAMRKLAGAISKTNCTVMFINQIREKVGVMYGCLHGDTLINFVDGRSIPIKDVVNNKINGKVWSFNEKTGEMEAREIIGWHNNGKVSKPEDYIHIETTSFDHIGGRFGVTVTPDHEIMTKNGWRHAKEIAVNDEILSKVYTIINGTLADFIWGTSCGDLNISIRDKGTACIRIQDNVNTEYMLWKKDKLSPFFEFTEKTYLAHGKTLTKYESNFTSELAIMKKMISNRNPMEFLNNHFSYMGLALWYMDDGCHKRENCHNCAIINAKRFANDSKTMNDIKNALKSLGFDVTIRTDGNICFTATSTQKLFDMICEYVPECMQYKLDEAHRGKYKDFTLTSTPTMMPYYVKVTSTRIASARQLRGPGKTKYDITIDGNHNYMAGGITNGIIVHNSPETTTGGRALKFYASVRVELRKGESLKNGNEMYGHKIKAKIVKNKVAPPYKTCEMTVIWGKGIDASEEILDLALEQKLIEKGGAWFTYKGQKFQGRDNVKAFFNDNPEEFAELKTRIMGIPAEDFTPTAEEMDDGEEDS